MGERAIKCSVCNRRFTDENGVMQHTVRKHGLKAARAAGVAPAQVRTRRRQDEDESIADRMIRAQLERAMGVPVEEDWLLDWMDE